MIQINIKLDTPGLNFDCIECIEWSVGYHKNYVHEGGHNSPKHEFHPENWFYTDKEELKRRHIDFGFAFHIYYYTLDMVLSGVTESSRRGDNPFD
ncbi:MAG: hypothetical protein LBL71_01515 [Endomicrobium sp.]|nr:hypothetical protein [Endomicrobium sp.]